MSLESSTKDHMSAPVQSHPLNLYFDQLKDQVFDMIQNEASCLERIQQLETELSAYKRAYADVDAEHRQCEKIKAECEKQKEILASQLQGHRVVTLIDGDGAIFASELIAQGLAGGHVAAQKLSDSILQHLGANYGANQYQLWVYIFYNKRGLVETFGRLGLTTLKIKFDDFAMGFNQAAERFLMVDVGNGKEAADAKIKAHLEDDIRLPQTSKVIFAGCHDNGYVTNLRSQITAGYKQKLILLKSYTDMAAGISELDLPTLTIPELFMPQKLGQPLSSVPPGLATVRRSSFVIPRPAMPPSITSDTPAAVQKPMAPDPNGPSSAVPDQEPISVQRPSLPLPSYAFAISNERRSETPDLDSGSDDSDDSDDLSVEAFVSSSFTSRHIDPHIPLSKHKPPPCTLFYLANCKHGADCRYAHDYILDSEHFNEIRTNAKKAPCPYVNKGETCIWGEDCCYGHVCPMSGNCYFNKKGKCKFTGVDMHKEPKVLINE
ncbi:hypothetical protein ARMSODRAFT_1018456 [Armillaria solidipes]|uniref:C3H1-type domain-containing protein n=1 Tax=Armillaria solidipes TaxID=1076256 RepID=A0A2H3C0N4_9AGAR|nr:hypothetical protein ARMSODRAFT_1018456 [Armillaria solidipes]